MLEIVACTLRWHDAPLALTLPGALARAGGAAPCDDGDAEGIGSPAAVVGAGSTLFGCCRRREMDMFIDDNELEKPEH